MLLFRFAVTEVKAKGKAALYKVSEFLRIKDKLEAVRENVHKSITVTEWIISRFDVWGSGMREAEQKIVNTFRAFADKETVDYSGKEKKFSKTELVKKPWKWQLKVYKGMEIRLDGAIYKVEDVAWDVELNRIKGKEVEMQVKAGNARKDIYPVSMVVELTEYQYGAEVFEEQNREFRSRIMKEQGKDAVAKGKR